MKNILKFKTLMALFLVLALASSEAYAYRGGHQPGRRGEWHHYRDGHWYRDGFFWFNTAVSALAIGALINRLPPKHTTVVYAGVPYYYAEGYYYRPYERGGYVVVQPPVVAQPVVVAQQVPVIPIAQNTQPSDMVTINIPNSRGGYTPVTLRKAGTGYVGPQGEYYSDNPTVEQLKTLYGGN